MAETDGELMEMLHRSRINLVKNVRPAEWQADSAYLSIATQGDMISLYETFRRIDMLRGAQW